MYFSKPDDLWPSSAIVKILGLQAPEWIFRSNIIILLNIYLNLFQDSDEYTCYKRVLH